MALPEASVPIVERWQEVSLVPCLLGRGVRLFDHLGPEPIDLEQVPVVESVGVTHLRYRVHYP
jgi:hypothetical protein